MKVYVIMKYLMPKAVFRGDKAYAYLLMLKLADKDYETHTECWDSYLLSACWKVREVPEYE